MPEPAVPTVSCYNTPMAFVYTQPYIVVGAFVVHEGKVLLIQENHYPDPGKWNIPAGKLDFGENIIKAVTREAHEEAGIDFTPTGLLGIHSIYRQDVPGEVHALRIIFVGDSTHTVSLSHGEPVDGKAEISNYQWLRPDEILTMDESYFRYHDIKPLTQNYIEGNISPLDVVRHIVQLPHA